MQSSNHINGEKFSPFINVENAWSNLKPKLDAEQKRREEKRKRRFIFFWFTTATIALAGSFVFFKNRAVENNNILFNKNQSTNQTTKAQQIAHNTTQTIYQKPEIKLQQLETDDDKQLNKKQSLVNKYNKLETKIQQPENSNDKTINKKQSLVNKNNKTENNTQQPETNNDKQINKKQSLANKNNKTENKFQQPETNNDKQINKNNLSEISNQQAENNNNKLLTTDNTTQKINTKLENSNTKPQTQNTKQATQLTYGLVWNFPVQKGANMLDINTVKQPATLLIPAVFVCKNLSKKHSIQLQLNPYSQYYINNKAVISKNTYIVKIQSGSQINNKPPDIVYNEFTSFNKLISIEASLLYNYQITNKFKLGFGFGNSWLQGALLQNKVIKNNIDITKDSLFGIDKSNTEWAFVAPSFLTGKFQIEYQIKKIQVGLSISKPITTMFNNMLANKTPINTNLYAKWNFK